MANQNRPALLNIKATAKAEVKTDTPEDLVAKGLILAERNVPYFIPAFRACNIKFSDKLPSIAAVDKYWRTYWLPAGVEWLNKAAQAVSADHPCTVCGEKKHNRFAYIAGVWLHEVSHVVFRHFDRQEAGKYFDNRRWAMATDLEINDDIAEIGAGAEKSWKTSGNTESQCPRLCMPQHAYVRKDEWLVYGMLGATGLKQVFNKGVWDMFVPVGLHTPDMMMVPLFLFPSEVPDGAGGSIQLPPNRLAEQYYDMIPIPPQKQGKSKDKKNKKKQDGQGESKSEGDNQGENQGKGQGKPGQDQESGDGGDSSEPGDGEGQDGDQQSENPYAGMDELADHGTGSGGQERPWEDGDPIDCEEYGLSEAEAHSVRQEVAAKTQKYAQGRGTVPAGWKVWADSELRPPKVRWEKLFQARVRQAAHRVRGNRFTSWRRLSRSSIVQDCAWVKPRTYSTTPVVAVVLDTSGSMGGGKRSRLERALSEAEGIIKALNCTIHFIDCDANTYGDAQKIRSIKSASVNGGGGTDMRVGIRAALKIKPRVDIIVLITDGDTPYPDARELKGVSMITAICNEDDTTDRVPKHMGAIWVDIEESQRPA